ncbi:MAG TPA: cytochrome c oxidase subunit 3 [Allosphingosinicella sp.]|nr:cytochrome c oxidase subunit 3 [Allosphingosinicella sp.]
MSALPPKFEGDLGHLPSHAFGHRSLTWWGVVAFFLIEGTAFALAVGAYFFLQGLEDSWPPQPYKPASLLAGTLFTIVIVLSEIPNTMVKRAAERRDLATVRKGMLILLPVFALLLVLRGFEFNSLNVHWYDNAYGSILWALLFLHLTHILTDIVDSVVLTVLIHTRHAAENRRIVDVAENAMYWRFVWLLWLPIYALIYWVPRWVS